MLEAIHLTKFYGAKLALDDLSFRINPGEIVGYLGPNGAGKSTTVKILSGILPATRGRVVICGRDLERETIAAKAQIGYLPEGDDLYESLTPREFLYLAGRLHSMDDQMISEKTEHFLELLELHEFAALRLAACSRGTRRKALLAAALIHNPKVLLLDEPLSALDANSASLVKELLRQLAARGKAVLFCSHQLDVVEKLCQRAIVINQGKIVADAPVAQLKALCRQLSLEAAFQELTQAGEIEERARRLARVVEL